MTLAKAVRMRSSSTLLALARLPVICGSSNSSAALRLDAPSDGSNCSSNCCTQQLRKTRMRDQYVFHVDLAERNAELQQVLRVAPQQGSLPPVQPGAEDKAVQAIVLRLPVEHRAEALFKRYLDGIEIKIGVGLVPQVEVLDPDGLAGLQLSVHTDARCTHRRPCLRASAIHRTRRWVRQSCRP